MNILQKTLSEMPRIFSSNRFSHNAKRNGLTKSEINNGVIACFLHQNAIQLQTKRMWENPSLKKDVPVQLLPNWGGDMDFLKELENIKIREKPSDTKEQECINYLKSLGYRIIKKETKYIEF